MREGVERDDWVGRVEGVDRVGRVYWIDWYDRDDWVIRLEICKNFGYGKC
jgi:hypothetical protein